jgi:hypothetical protein
MYYIYTRCICIRIYVYIYMYNVMLNVYTKLQISWLSRKLLIINLKIIIKDFNIILISRDYTTLYNYKIKKYQK